MIFKDYYRILGLDNNKVSLDEIKIAFREQAKKYHPDVNKGRNSEERFKDINEAYKILSSASNKRKYDRAWNSKIGRKQPKERTTVNKETILNDFSNIFFGKSINKKEEKIETTENTRRLPIKGENVDTEINISIEDGFFGKEKKISLRAVNGKMRTFSVKVPSGIRNGEKIRLLGQGKPGRNGGKNGDMFIKINIQNDNKFKLDGYDLITDLFLSPWEAALGKRVNLQSIEESVSIYVPPGIQSGEKIKIPQKGYKDGTGSRGDLVAEIKTVVPKKLTDQEKNLFEELKNISRFNPRV